MRKNFAILFSFLIIQTLATKALASSWGTTIVCRGPNLTVRMTLPSSLPPNGGVNAGGTMTLSSGNQTSPMMKAAITMPDPASLGVMGQNGYACVVHKVIDSALNDMNLSGTCGFVAAGNQVGVTCVSQLALRR